MVEQHVADAAVDVVELLRSLAEEAPDEYALAYLGAGPIEGVLSAHGERLGDVIEEAARMHEKFRTAFRCAWFDQSVNPELACQLRRFGAPL